ncbi:MAG: PKD domain-containing protein [Saprospiraceae bacterium]
MGLHLPKFSWLIVVILSAVAFQTSAQNYPMNGTPINDCGGYFTDSGGGNGSYGVNENFTTTICSDGPLTHISLYFSGIDIGEGDDISFYNADGPIPGTEIDESALITPNNPFIIQASATNPSGCITVTFTSDNIDDGNAGWSAAISCVRSCQTILSDLVSTIPVVMPADTGYIDICPLGQRVTFRGRGLYPENGFSYNQSDLTSTFEWTFGDGNTAVEPNVTNVFTQPGGYTVQLEITDQQGCKNTSFISQRVRVAPYPTFGYDGTLDPVICSGDTINISSAVEVNAGSNLTAFPGVNSFQRGASVSDTLFIPDGAGGFYEESVALVVLAQGAVVTSPDDITFVRLELEHSYSGDLDIELICPDGTSIYLHEFPSGTGSTNFGIPWATAPVDGMSNTTNPGCGFDYYFVNNAANGTLQQFDATAPQITYTPVPNNLCPIAAPPNTYTDTYFPAGEYRPEESFANLIGCPPMASGRSESPIILVPTMAGSLVGKYNSKNTSTPI